MLDGKQARWLETRLAEVHSVYREQTAADVRTGHDDRLVILFSHHGTDHTAGGHAGPEAHGWSGTHA